VQLQTLAEESTLTARRLAAFELIVSSKKNNRIGMMGCDSKDESCGIACGLC